MIMIIIDYHTLVCFTLERELVGVVDEAELVAKDGHDAPDRQRVVNQYLLNRVV